MNDQVIDSVTEIIEWARTRCMSREVSWEDAEAISMEFNEWMENDEIDLLYLDSLN
jgi:hypothetical protein